MQLWLRPYREPESNQLKVLVETQIFLTFLLSFILRVLPSDGRSSLEPLGATFYGWVLVASLLALCTAALLLTAAQIRRRSRQRKGLPVVEKPLNQPDTIAQDGSGLLLGGSE